MRRFRWYHALAFVLAHWILAALGGAYALATRWDDWSGVKWTWWGFLVLGALVPAVVVFVSVMGSERFVPRLRVASIAPMMGGPRGWRARARFVPAIFRGAALTLACAALARPENLLKDEQSTERGIDIVLVLDLSGSMRAVMDAPDALGAQPPQAKRPTRLDTAKDVIQDFIARRKTDRIGVVVFGKAAYVLSPPTLDYSLLTTLVGKMDLDLIDGNGTAIGDAVGTGVARLRRSNAKSKAIILLTDGDSNAGAVSPDYAAHLAQTQGVHVYTVQIGNGDESEVQEGVDLFGQPRYVRARFPVNPELLKKIATQTGGESFVATDKVGLERSMHAILDSLEKSKILAQNASVEELFPLFLWPAVLFVMMEAMLRVFVLRRFP
ncbi:MAG TPA: VWA domain-containing protein [Polyangiaceae bacterium]